MATEVRGEVYEEMARTLLGNDGLALAGVAGELVKRLAAGVPIGYSLRIEVDRGVDRDEARLIVGHSERGEAEWLLRHDGEPDGDVEMWLLHVNPALRHLPW